MTGHIRRRGERSWELKFDIGADQLTGKRRIRYASFKGTKRDAERELTRLLAAADAGTLVEPSKLTIAGYLAAWLGGPHGLAGKTAERYQQLAEQQIIPRLGALALQKLKPAHIRDWHEKLLTGGGKDGRPLSARTVQHAHRVLHRLLARAVESELLLRNVASVVRPPRAAEVEIESLKADQIDAVLAALRGQPLEPIAVLALSSGARRGEILALAWENVDLDGGTMRIERSIEQTKAGLKFKAPKTKHGRRVVTLPPIALDALRAHRRHQLELRLAVGLGRFAPDSLVFSTIDGNPIPPNNLSRDWRRFVKASKLPAISFHALRHSHASALIATGIDALTVSRRIGHASAVVTLGIYGHLFSETDKTAAKAIEAALRTGKER